MCVAGRNNNSLVKDLSLQPAVLSIAFAISVTIGGIVMGLAVSVSGLVLKNDQVGLLFLIAAAFTLILLLLEGFGVRLMRPPCLKRQVSPATLLSHTWMTTSVIWGFELGLGFLTRINSWAFWSAITLVAWIGDPAFGVVAGGVYGLARGLQPLATVLSRSRDVFKLTDVVRVFEERAKAGALLGLAGLILILGTSIL